MELQEQNINERIDQLELAMQAYRPVNCPLTHTFFPGLYVRKIFMPKGEEGEETLITSMVHNTTHPFFVMKGKVAVFCENDGVQIIEAGYDGITTPNTRRVLRILEDCVWITTHPTSIMPVDNTEQAILEAVDKVEQEIMKPYVNELLGGKLKNNVLFKEVNY